MKTTTTTSSATTLPSRRKPTGAALRANQRQRRPVPASAPPAALLDPPLSSAKVPPETCAHCQAVLLANGTRLLCINCGNAKPVAAVRVRRGIGWNHCIGKPGDGACFWKALTRGETCPRCSVH